MRDQTADKNTHLLTYAAPITRKMFQFNDLTYFSVPPLPSEWKAPEWLRMQLGIYSGRLCFEWNEYEPLCKFLGIEEGCDEASDEEAELGVVENGTTECIEEHANDATAHPNEDRSTDALVKPKQDLLVSRPLTFLQEWLAVRRRGQDFAHSPMGFMAQGKMLQEDHPFFRKAHEDSQVGSHAERELVPVTHASQGLADQVDDYHGVDDMGANEAADSDAGEDDIEYADSEFGEETDSGDEDDYE